MTVLHGDCIELMRGMDDASIDAVVTDPPYGLEFMGREWDRLAPVDRARMNGERRDHGTDRAGGYERAGVRYVVDGGAAQAWHTVWATEALRVLKSGGHLLAFGGTRTYHRLAAGIEDARFDIRDCVAWLYGSGFPKSRDVGGGRGTALKPAFEPIVVARKPLAGTVAANVDELGTGALNIDACRIDGAPVHTFDRVAGDRSREQWRTGTGENRRSIDRGRWPANVVLDEAAGAQLDEQTGTLTSGANPTRRGSDKFRDVYGDFGGQEECTPARGADSGGASRFFYCAKASTAERGAGNNHPTVKPVELMRWLVRLVTPAGGTVLDPFAGSGTTLVAAAIEGFNAIGIEREAEYVEIIRRRLAQPLQPVLGGMA